jgi:hypothetical protein
MYTLKDKEQKGNHHVSISQQHVHVRHWHAVPAAHLSDGHDRTGDHVMRIITAYGLPGYGPDASDDNYGVSDSWPQVAYELKRMLEESADSAGDQAEAYANAGDYEEAWNTRKHADEMYNLAANLDNKRKHAPLYEGNPQLWAETLEKIVTENFPYDVDQSCRIYAWESEDFGADSDDEWTPRVTAPDA